MVGELCLLLGEVVLQEVERVLVEETGHILTLHTNTNTRPDLTTITYSGMMPIAENPHHKVLIYTEYHSVSPPVGIGTPPTPLRRRVRLPPLNQRAEGHTQLRVGGGESQFRQFRRLEKKLSTLPTL